MNWIGGPFLHWLTSSCIGKIVYIRSSNALVNRILQNVFAKDKISFVKIKNDNDCNFLNCKIKGSNLRFICSWRVLSTPSGPYQALNPKMDNHKRRKLQRMKLSLFHSLLDLATPSSIWHQAPPWNLISYSLLDFSPEARKQRARWWLKTCTTVLARTISPARKIQGKGILWNKVSRILHSITVKEY